MKTAKTLITERELLIANIKKNWDRIRIENVADSGPRNYDIQGLYKAIISDSKKLVDVKVEIQAANMGFTEMSQVPATCIYPSIYALQQLKEQKIKLNMMPTKGKNVILSPVFVTNEVQEIDVMILAIEKQLENFNNSVEFGN
jgi:hypothetical protein